LAAAICVYPGNVVVDSAAHQRQPDRDFHPMPCPVMLDVGDLGHYASFDHYFSPSRPSADPSIAEMPARFPRFAMIRKMTLASSYIVTHASIFS
jgi:hypothetical protein